MEIFINGESMTLPAASTVNDLLRACGRDRSPCAVEVNRQLVPKREHEAHQLAEGDRVELVTLVGGG